jgi:predicted dehydrogenase
MSKVKKIALVGIGGFSRYHYDRIKELEPQGKLKLSAVMIREKSLERHQDIAEVLRAGGVKIYTTYEDMLAGEEGVSQIVVLPTGISDHCEMSLAALEKGYHVICEKPVAGTLEECMRMKEAQEKTGKVLAICFQNIYSPIIQRMKKIALSGELGALKSAKTYVLWQRADAYYKRTWGGKLVFEGKTINDCPLMNATAHYLNNMLYVSGKSLHEAALPVSIYGENYRIKKIESCDTQFLRVVTDTGVRLIFITSHSTDVRVDPQAEYLFENGKITWDFSGNAVVFRKTGGGYEQIERIDGGEGNSGFFKMIYQETCEAIDCGSEPAATIQNSYQHVMCVDRSFRSGPIVDVPEEYVGSTDVMKDDDCLKAGDVNRYLKGIKPLVKKMFAEEKSFYEAGCPWAVKSRAIEVAAVGSGTETETEERDER